MTVAELRARRNDIARDALSALEAAEAAEGTPDAEVRHQELLTKQEEIREWDERIQKAEGIEQARAQFQPLADPDPTPPAETRARDTESKTDAHVVRNAPIYSPDTREERSFFHDVMNARMGDSGALERLTRNTGETRDELKRLARDATSRHERDRYGKMARAVGQTAGAIGEVIFPAYLDAYVPYLRAGRPFADQCLSAPMPNTNSLSITKLTGGTSTGVQSSDNSALSNADPTTAYITAQAQTVGGYNTVSRQLLDLGTLDVDQMIFQDLMADLFRTLDQKVINGSATNAKGVLNTSSINAITYTDASPTGPKLWPSFFQGRSQVKKSAYVPVDFVAMHPSTWEWFLASLDSQNRPLALDTTSAKYNAFAEFNPEAQGFAGNVTGIPVIEDANIPVNLGAGTNQAPIIMCNRQTLRLYESAPKMIIADQPLATQLSVSFVVYEYYMFTAARLPQMISVINGTGCIVQAGY